MRTDLAHQFLTGTGRMGSPTTAARGQNKLWAYFAWGGLALTVLNALTKNWVDVIGFGVATIGMFVSARHDFYQQTWTKVVSVSCAAVAIAVWTLW